jgi:hypothetical protein
MQPYNVKPGEDLRIPPHPHAGFEVVTYLLDGEFFHRDSKGHDQVARGGDINWMTSGSGIVHSEGPTAQFLKEVAMLSCYRYGSISLLIKKLYQQPSIIMMEKDYQLSRKEMFQSKC